MTSREKVRRILGYLEAEQLSSRGAASLIEVDRTLSTWPQLASDVVLGAAALAEAVCRIGLAEKLRSGRTRIDIGSAFDHLDEPHVARRGPVLVDGHDPLELPGMAGVIAGAAIRAPSGGNLQPWHVQAGPTGITIDIAPQQTSTMDVGFRGSAVAVGAALLNAKIAADAHHVLGPVKLEEQVDGSLLRATLKMADGTDPGLARLYQPMLQRETNRHHGKPEAIDPSLVEALSTAAQREGAQLHLLTQKDQISRAAMLLGESDRIRYLTSQLHQ